jgi:hypothetical protein
MQLILHILERTHINTRMYHVRRECLKITGSVVQGTLLKYNTFLGSGCLQNANKPPELPKDKLNGKRK